MSGVSRGMRGGCLGKRIRGVSVRGLGWGAVAVFLAFLACLGLVFALACGDFLGVA
jgi:hypothetical protein